ncbi:MAG: hypothetical protein QOC97_45 [Chloroflexota bacterium]|jgi:hypothetical protein|nr:hypothetical protein [Chloroflexota bacterium]
MATDTYDTTASRTPGSGTSKTDAASGAVSDAAGAVKGAASDAVARLPDVAATTRSAIEDANRQMRAGSDEMLAVGTILSFGFAMGLLIGGASRILVAAALTPAAAMGLTMLDRSSRTRAAAVGTRRVQGA